MRKHLSYANVVATLALIVAVAGGTTAVAISGKAAKNSVTSKSIKDGSVTGRDLASVRVGVFNNATIATCLPGERLLSAGLGFPDEVSEFGPTEDGNTWLRISKAIGGAGRITVLCLKATPGK